MEYKTFRGWLINQKHRDDPVGDLARDVIADKGSRARTASGIVGRIIHGPHCLEALDALLRAYLFECSDYTLEFDLEFDDDMTEVYNRALHAQRFSMRPHSTA